MKEWIICVTPVVVPVGRSLKTGDAGWEYWISKGGERRKWRLMGVETGVRDD